VRKKTSPIGLRSPCNVGYELRVSNMHVRAYMRELGKKGGKARGERKKRPLEQYQEMAQKSALARRKKPEGE